MKKSRICPMYSPMSQMYWNLICKSPGFVPFGANLTHFGAKPTIPGYHHLSTLEGCQLGLVTGHISHPVLSLVSTDDVTASLLLSVSINRRRWSYHYVSPRMRRPLELLLSFLNRHIRFFRKSKNDLMKLIHLDYWAMVFFIPEVSEF